MKNSFILTQQSFSHQLCSLKITHRKNQSDIVMQLFSEHVTTKTLPQTLQLLKEVAPSVLRTKCHNDLHLPFHKEVQDTEIGHLFEHLILDYCSRHSEDERRTYYGVTEWDWHTEPRGTFHIAVSTGRKDQDLLYQAIAYSYEIIERLFVSPSPLQSTSTALRTNHTETAVTASACYVL